MEFHFSLARPGHLRQSFVRKWVALLNATVPKRADPWSGPVGESSKGRSFRYFEITGQLVRSPPSRAVQFLKGNKVYLSPLLGSRRLCYQEVRQLT